MRGAHSSHTRYRPIARVATLTALLASLMVLTSNRARADEVTLAPTGTSAADIATCGAIEDDEERDYCYALETLREFHRLVYNCDDYWDDCVCEPEELCTLPGDNPLRVAACVVVSGKSCKEGRGLLVRSSCRHQTTFYRENLDRDGGCGTLSAIWRALSSSWLVSS